MKNLPIFVLLFVSCILFCSCTKTIPPEKLQIRNGIAYEVNSETPFTGMIKCTDSTNLYETEYENGKVDGIHKEKYSDGKLKDLSHYKNGLADGLQEHYFSNGQKQFSVNYKNGKLDGETVEFYESGQIKIKEIYSNDKVIQFNSWYSNGQQQRVLNFENEKLSKLDWFYENGKNQINFKNDKNSFAGQLTVYNEKGDIEKISYYLNTIILPMDFILALPDTLRIKDIEKTFGKPAENIYSTPVLKYSDYRWYSINSGTTELVNKAFLQFATGFDKKGKETPLGITIVYYNKTIEEDNAVNQEMHDYLILNGFTKDPKKEKYFDKARNLSVEVILKINNNTTYSIIKKHSKL